LEIIKAAMRRGSMARLLLGAHSSGSADAL
jgi:hypothetical protein